MFDRIIPWVNVNLLGIAKPGKMLDVTRVTVNGNASRRNRT
jgi:hypothetical protein